MNRGALQEQLATRRRACGADSPLHIQAIQQQKKVHNLLSAKRLLHPKATENTLAYDIDCEA